MEGKKEKKKSGGFSNGLLSLGILAMRGRVSPVSQSCSPSLGGVKLTGSEHLVQNS